MIIKRDKFDFEIGYLVKSPCRECPNLNNLPKCSDACVILDDIRVILAKGISCTGKQSSVVS
ncbi:MAG: hypothetical protein C4518_14780 [Desulfobacteraceae bacterium]|nr:MAG: hypothetical protein C4518_14780 [Desulfobacteraceae bacterium]